MNPALNTAISAQIASLEKLIKGLYAAAATSEELLRQYSFLGGKAHPMTADLPHIHQPAWRIITLVAAAARVPIPKLLAKSRGSRCAHIVQTRHVAAWMLREFLGLTFAEIGTLLKRDHGTIIAACCSVQDRKDTEPVFAAHLADLKDAIQKDLDESILHSSPASPASH